MFVELTERASQAVRAQCTPGAEWRDISTRLSNGNRGVELDDALVARLVKLQFEGESLSDTVERLCAVWAARGVGLS
jgi:hypothetical protein